MAKKNEAQIKFTANVKDFTSGIKDMNSNITTLNKQLKLNQAEMKNNGESVEALRKEQELLEKKLKSSADKVEYTSKCLEEAKAIFGENSKEVQKWRNKLIDAETQNVKIQTALNNTNRKLEDMITTTNKTESALDKLNKEIQEQESELNDLKEQYVEICLTQGKTSKEAQELASKIKQVSNELTENKNAVKNAEAEFDNLIDTTNTTITALNRLKNTIDEQESELSKLKEEYQNVVLEQGDASDEAQRLARKIDDLSTKLKENKDKLDDVRQSSDKLDNSLDDLDDSAEQAGDGFDVMNTALGEFTGNIMTKAVEKVQDMISYIWELIDATEEYRIMMAKMEGSTAQYDKTRKHKTPTDEASQEQYKTVYSYTGDEQATVNAITNTQKLGLSVADNNLILDSAIAVWTAYGDSIPIEGLTESITETAQVGKVTGSLADALNWAGINEDKFNEKLAKCNSEQERADLIRRTLNKSYGESKAIYDENTESIRKNREAEAELMEVEAKLAETMEPVNTKFLELKTQFLEALLPAIELVCNGIFKLIDWWNGLSESTQDFIKGSAIVAGVLITVVTTVFTVVSVIGILWSSFNSISLALTACGGALSIFTGGIAVSGSVLMSWVAIIGIIIGVVVALAWYIYKHWDEIKEFTINTFNAIKDFLSDVWNNIVEGFKQDMEAWKAIWGNIKQFFADVWNNIVNGFKSDIERIKTMVNNGFNIVQNYIINPIKTAYNNIKTIFTNILNIIKEKMETAKSTVKNIIDKIKGFFNFTVSLPKIKLPHFSISPPGWKIGDLLKGSIPKLGIEWYANGGIMTQPTLFGGGEAGHEAILPLDSFYTHLDEKLDNIVRSTVIDYDRMTDSFISALSHLSISMDSKEVGKLTSTTVQRTTNARTKRLDRLNGNTNL